MSYRVDLKRPDREGIGCDRCPPFGKTYFLRKLSIPEETRRERMEVSAMRKRWCLRLSPDHAPRHYCPAHTLQRLREPAWTEDPPHLDKEPAP